MNHLPGLWDPKQPWIRRNGCFRTDLAHEFGHPIAASHFDFAVTMLTLEDIEIGHDAITVRGACSTVWWASIRATPRHHAALAAAGAVAEALLNHNGDLEAARHILRSDPACVQDLADIVTVAQRHHPQHTDESCERSITEAISEAADVLRPQANRLWETISEYESFVRDRRLRNLDIEWTEDLAKRFT